MTEKAKRVPLELVHTGVPNLDAVLGGGLPAYSLTILAGPAGSGKTILAQQIMFHLASRGGSALYLSVLGEPTLKLLRYQQQFAFFDADQVGKSVHFFDLGEVAKTGGALCFLAALQGYLEKYAPSFVVDSIRAAQQTA